MGTTTLALFCEECVVAAWDSWTTSIEFIRNDETPDKMFKITPNKVCIKAGVVDALNAMQKHVQEKVKKRLDKEKPFSVLNVSFDVFMKLVRVDDETECLITGWDETLERFDLWHAHSFLPSELKSVENYQACGTGRFYTLKMLKQFWVVFEIKVACLYWLVCDYGVAC
ncbi:uncharacterized protein LOC121049200 [Rosa chinensis]|uniref:uncharacterized protein LOC121049200 n=1 Tax=Rosa chinensis TaxID=74649 RepID=UPI001AD8D630|nr:uncharacterized protein LOC121049200 [Rosa chinensis]